MKTSKGFETKEHIINTCKELFYSHGYNATTTRMIAKKADINLGLLNYYFKGKNELGSMIYFETRNGYGELLDSLEGTLSPVDRFLFSSAVELYLCLVNHNYATFYLDMINEDNVHERLQNFIIDKIKTYGILRDNPSHSLFSAINLSSIKPALVRHAHENKGMEESSIDDYILYYLEQQLSCFGRSIVEAPIYLEKLKNYHIDIASNFTPILVKIR